MNTQAFAPMTKNYDIAIVGGGASGMMAAIATKRTEKNLRVCVLERLPRVGKKLLATGNGRCNLTNEHISPECFHGKRLWISSVLSHYDVGAVQSQFKQLGLLTAPDDKGRVYPLSLQASAVLDVLRLSMEELGIAVYTDTDIITIKKGFLLTAKNGFRIKCRAVIMASGGPASPKLGGTDAGLRLLSALGHPIVQPLPALVPLLTDATLVRALKGQRFSGRIALMSGAQVHAEREGEILFTDTGFSGIASMELGQCAAQLIHAKKKAEISLSLFSMPQSGMFEILIDRRSQMPHRLLEDFLTGMIAKRIAQSLLKSANIGPLSRTVDSLSDTQLHALSAKLVDWRMPLTGTQGLESAQVSAGGLDTDYFDCQTLESTIVPGLYATGEVLNIHGDCGGYNLHFAWVSALTAAQSICRFLKG